jgi:hypothetical protein
LLAPECFLLLLLRTSLLPNLALLSLLLAPSIFPTSLLFQPLLFLVLLDTLAVLFPTLLLFGALLFLVLLDTLAVLLPTLLLLRALLFLSLLRALTHFLRTLTCLVLLRGTSRFTFCGGLLVLSLTSLVSLFLFLLMLSTARGLLGLSLVTSLLILLASFLSAAPAPLRAGNIGNSKSHHQRKHPRGCEVSIVNFH